MNSDFDNRIFCNEETNRIFECYLCVSGVILKLLSFDLYHNALE